MGWLVGVLLTMSCVIILALGLFHDIRTTGFIILLVIIGGITGAIIQTKKK